MMQREKLEAGDAPTFARLKRKRFGARPFLTSILLVWLIDQTSKWIAIHYLSNTDLPIISRIGENTGIAFGILPHLGSVTFVIALAVTAGAIIYYLWVRGRDRWVDRALGFLVGGAVANLTDRAFRGHVIDFIDFGVWPVFNLADAAITCAVVLLIWRASRDGP